MKGLVMEFETLDFYPKEKACDYFKIIILELDFGKKTPSYAIMSIKGEDLLGNIEYYPAWRRFILVPSGCTLWSGSCLENIISFLEELNKAHKEELENRKLKT